MGKYDDLDWDELPADAKSAADTLGYDKDKWDNDKTPSICSKAWSDLTDAQKNAASVLGYKQEEWDADSESESDSE